MTTPDFDRFHRKLQEQLDDEPRIGIAPVGTSIAFELNDGRSFTYRQAESGATIESGANADCVVKLEAEAWQLFATQYYGLIALVLTERAEVSVGGFAEFAAWDAALKHLYFGRSIYKPPAEPYAPPSAFTLEDSDQAMAEALEHYGFILIKSVFAPDEVATMQADVQAAKARARPDDGQSWWATLASGDEVCCRVNYLSDQSAMIDSLTTDSRMLRVGALPDAGLVCCDRHSDGHSVVIKYHDVAQGLADLPWHTDCGNGGHDLLCPGMNLGIQLDAATAESGQVHYLPGSTNAEVVGGRPQKDWQTFAIDTDPGDLTVHMGHTWHVAPAPSQPGAGRRALYLSFQKPELGERMGDYEAYNDVLFTGGSGRIRVDT